MARKSMKDAATAGTSVFDQIASGNTQDVSNVQNVPDANNVQNKQYGRPPKYESEMVRLNLKVPIEIKTYLQAAAYRESSPQHMLSLTEYFIRLVKEDMEKHKND